MPLSLSKQSFRQAAGLFEPFKRFKKSFDPTRKGTLTVHLRAKRRRRAAVALRIALRGSLSHYPSLRNLWLKGLSAVLSGMASGPCRFLISPISGPDIITRGFVYVKESEGLMEELRKVAVKALEECRMDTMNDWASIKSEIKNAISGFLYKKTKRNPMILPVIMEV